VTCPLLASNVRECTYTANTVLYVLPGRATVSALNDVGLFATAYGGILVVADCHTQDIVVRSGTGPTDYFSRQLGAQEDRLIKAEANSEIVWLTFSVCRTANDPMLALRLIVGRANGFVTVWSFERTSIESWMGFRADSVTLPSGFAGQSCVCAQVLGPAGATVLATEASVQRAIVEQEAIHVNDNLQDFYVLLVVYERGAVLLDQVTGARISRTEFPDAVVSAAMVDRQGIKVLLAMSSNSIFVVSLPRMDTVHRVQRHVPPSQEVVASTPRASIDTLGDLVELTDGHQIRLWTTFATMPHGERPSLFLFTPRTLPLHPSEGAGGYIASVAGWLGSSAGQSLSYGAQIDTVLAGSRRPKAPPLPARMTFEQEKSVAPPKVAPVADAPGADCGGTAGAAGEGSRQRSWFDVYQRQLTSITSSSARSQAQLNMQLLHKRDELLAKYVRCTDDSLDESMSTLERGAKNLVKQCVSCCLPRTRNAALKAAARDKLESYM